MFWITVIGPCCTVVVIYLAVDSTEAENTVTNEGVHMIVARCAVDTRLWRTLVDLRLTAGSRKPSRTSAEVGTQAIDTRSTVLTDACWPNQTPTQNLQYTTVTCLHWTFPRQKRHKILDISHCLLFEDDARQIKTCSSQKLESSISQNCQSFTHKLSCKLQMLNNGYHIWQRQFWWKFESAPHCQMTRFCIRISSSVMTNQNSKNGACLDYCNMVRHSATSTIFSVSRTRSAVPHRISATGCRFPNASIQTRHHHIQGYPHSCPELSGEWTAPSSIVKGVVLWRFYHLASASHLLGLS